MTKKINTTVSTGDTFTSAGYLYKVGKCRKINGKMVIDVTRQISQYSCITIQVSTVTLNKMINA